MGISTFLISSYQIEVSIRLSWRNSLQISALLTKAFKTDFCEQLKSLHERIAFFWETVRDLLTRNLGLKVFAWSLPHSSQQTMLHCLISSQASSYGTFWVLQAMIDDVTRHHWEEIVHLLMEAPPNLSNISSFIDVGGPGTLSRADEVSLLLLTGV